MANKKNKKKKNNQKKAQPQAPAKKNYLPLIIGICVVVVLILAIALWPKDQAEEETFTSQGTETVEPTETEEPEVEAEEEVEEEEAPTYEDIQAEARAALEDGVDYYADIDIQDYGTITVKLAPDEAPISTENFVSLAESGFYDGLTFHRIMYGFMMQGGDPLGNGTGGSMQYIVGEFANNGITNNMSHTRGAISMARSMDPNSASSQFFIVHADSTFLDGDYAVFGYVTEGIEVVDAVCETAQPVDGNGSILTAEQPVINTITIRTEPIAE